MAVAVAAAQAAAVVVAHSCSSSRGTGRSRGSKSSRSKRGSRSCSVVALVAVVAAGQVPPCPHVHETTSTSRYDLGQPLVQVAGLLPNYMPALCIMSHSRSAWRNKPPRLALSAQMPSLHIVQTGGGTSLSLAETFSTMGTSSWKADDVDLSLLPLSFHCFFFGQ